MVSFFFGCVIFFLFHLHSLFLLCIFPFSLFFFFVLLKCLHCSVPQNLGYYPNFVLCLSDEVLVNLERFSIYIFFSNNISL